MKLVLKSNLTLKVKDSLREGILKDIEKTSKEDVEALLTKVFKECIYESIVDSDEDVLKETISAKLTLEKGDK